MKMKFYNRLFLVALLVLIVGLGGSSIWFYTYELDKIRNEKKADLDSFADFNVSILANWQNERYGEIDYISTLPDIKEVYSGNSAIVPEWVNPFLADRNYNALFFVTNEGDILYRVVPDNNIPYGEENATEFSVSESKVNYYQDNNGSIYTLIKNPVQVNNIQAGYLVISVGLYGGLLSKIIGPSENKLTNETYIYDDQIKSLFPLLVGKDYLTSLPDADLLSGEILEFNTKEEVPNLIQAKKIPFTDQYLIARMEIQDSYLDLQSFSNFFLLTNGIMIAVIVLTMILLIRRRDYLHTAFLKEEKRKNQVISGKFNTLFTNANDVIIHFDLTGQILECNKKGIELYGYSWKELTGMNISDLRYEKDRMLNDYHMESVKAKTQYEFTTRHVAKTGQVFDVEVCSSKIELEGKVFIQSIIRDVTKRLENERNIKKLNRFYSLLSSVNRAIVKNRSIEKIYEEVIDALVTIGKANLVFIATREGNEFRVVAAGATDKEKLNENYSDLKFPAENEFVRRLNAGEVLIGKMSDGDNIIFETGHKLLSLPLRTYTVSGFIINENLEGIIVIYTGLNYTFTNEEINLFDELSHDLAFAINAIKIKEANETAELKLRTQKKNMSTLLKNMPGIAFRCLPDEHWSMLFMSAGTYGLTGYGYEDFVINKSVKYDEIIFAPDREEVAEKIHLSLARRIPYSIEYRIITKDKKMKWVGEIGEGRIDDIEGRVIEGVIFDITEIKKAQEVLKNSRDFYLYLFNHLPNPIFKTNTEGKVDYVNSAWLSFTGLTRREALGMEWMRIIHTEDYIYFKKNFMQIVENKKEAQFEIKIETTSGEIKWMAINIIPFDDISKNFSGFLGSCFDITKRREAVTDLHQSEKRYRELFENNPQPMWVYNTDTLEFLSVNDAAVQVYGYSREEFLNMTVLDIRPENEHARFLEYIGTQIDFMNWDDGWFHRKKDGSVIEVEVRSHSLPDANGIHQRLVLAIDVTEKKKNLRLLKESEEKFKSIYENTSVGLFTFGEDEKIIMANPAYLNIMGFRDLEEASKINFLSSDYYNSLTINMLRTAFGQSGSLNGFETTWRNHKGREIFIRLNLNVVHKNGKTFYEGSVEDITIKREAEKQLIRAKDEALKSAAMKSNFLAQMSHEIRTPVNVITNFAGIIRDKYTDTDGKDEDIESSFEAIDSAGHRLIRTVDMILNMSQIQAGTYEAGYENFDFMDEVFNPVYREFYTYAESKDISLILIKPSFKVNVFADLYSTRQIFTYIVDNAIKYTSKGMVRIYIEQDELYFSGVVEDTGIGIEESFISKVFEPFSQEYEGYTRQYDGSGLGLTLVKKYCEVNNYTISLSSKKGKGTVFKIKMPRR